MSTVPVAVVPADPILCCYVNKTDKLQVGRIVNIPNWHFERVVLPGQRLLFEAQVAGLLEVHVITDSSTSLLSTIPCPDLQISTDLINQLLNRLS
ncbi:DUF1830 domain-containing protein [Leptodesmis sichuanensis]|uniref:DUF1830 domain-containing protein n=1 Tax=Leptodesmis sichuanensis TaxID=2906798 RepID=UPI001F1AB2B9|nr:DUF1830 domain-containing protein [Leptodesmis sichuanensis]UIE37625.1 DUF1830 domain-containing protein [Leptodesmis sichuanensis A121]